jgi:ABC-2 type transport system ATP-binding protein
MSPNALSVKKLTKVYQTGVQALKGIDLEIKAGQFYGLLGPNGAGKSTLIHCTTGLAIPSDGHIKVFGDDAVSDYRAARSHVGLAPQDINLDWFLTVFETLDYHGGYFGMRKQERKERAEELMEAFSLTEKRDSNIRTLSGGMKRRLVLARALMHRPKLVILDEPTAGVDVELRLELWRYMKKVNKEGTSILLTTHYIEEAEELCDQIALINHGTILRTGTVAQLKKAYKKKSLEDVYLEIIGRQDLGRGSLSGLGEMS